MITPSLRRAVLYHSSPQSIPRPASPSIATVFPSRTHQRRYSSSKPPVPPNDGRTSVPNPSVKSVATPKSKEAAGEKRSGAVSRLSRRATPRDTGDHGRAGSSEWATSLPSVASTQHLDPKDVFVASFFSNHRPMSVTSAVPLSAPEDMFQSIFAPKKPASKSKHGSADVIYTLASTVKTLDSSIFQAQNQEQPPAPQRQHERSDLISALTQGNHAQTTHPQESQHLDGPPRQNIPLRIPNGVKMAMQQIARQFRPFNPPPAPQPVSDAQIEAKVAENAAAVKQLETQEAPHQRQRRMVISVHSQGPDGTSHRFFTPHTTEMENSPQLQWLEETGDAQQSNIHFDPKTDMMEPQRPRRMGRMRQGAQWKSPGLRRQKLQALSVKRQRKLKMKKHKYKKLMRRTRTLRRKLDK